MVNNFRSWSQILQTKPRCLLCGGIASASTQLCARCEEDLPWITHACLICSKPLPMEAICGECQKKTPIYMRSRIALRYAYPIDQMIQRLKFSQQLDIACALASLLATVLDPSSLPQCLIPVPMHRHRLRERGFNQATEIARHLSRRTGIALAQDLCRRARATPAQSGLAARTRRRNVRGAFEADTATAGLRHVAIVDDVVTTGATVSEVAKALRKAGIEEIEVWACARTVHMSSA